MNAIEKAEEYYRDALRLPEPDIKKLMSNPLGVVVWSTQLVLLAKYIGEEELDRSDIRLDYESAAPRGVYVHLMSGNMDLASRILHVKTPDFLVFQRGKRSAKWHKVAVDRITRKLEK